MGDVVFPGNHNIFNEDADVLVVFWKHMDGPRSAGTGDEEEVGEDFFFFFLGSDAPARSLENTCMRGGDRIVA